MKVMIGAVAHESNTFTPLGTRWDDFTASYGADLLSAPGRGALGGIVNVLSAAGLELAPTISCHALPGGLVERRAFEQMREALLAGTDGVGAVCLFLHGAMRAEGEDYADAALVTAVRAAVGPHVPIVVAMDLHGNPTQAMAEAADALVAYRTAPHVDTFETGERAARLLLRLLNQGIGTGVGLAKLPMLLPGEMAQTAYEPMVSMMRLLAETDSRQGVLCSSFFKVHCWADVPDTGVAAVVVTESDAALAQAEAERLAGLFWQRRAEFRATVETYVVDKAIDVALAAPEPTVFLSDSGDNPGAGGTTDVPHMVQRLLAKGARSAVIAAIWDREAYETCAQAGVGARVSMSIGGKVDTWHGRPLAVSGRVRALSGGRYCEGGVRLPGNLLEMGPLAVLDLGGVEVMLSRERVSIVDPEQLRVAGIEPLAYKIVVVKRGYLEPLFQAIAQRAILALSPGATNCDVTKLEYRRVRRPMHPLDPDAVWP